MAWGLEHRAWSMELRNGCAISVIFFSLCALRSALCLIQEIKPKFLMAPVMSSACLVSRRSYEHKCPRQGGAIGFLVVNGEIRIGNAAVQRHGIDI